MCIRDRGSVIVLEAEEALAHHASGRSAALFEPRYGAPAVVRLSMASETYLRSVPGVLSPRGLLLVGKADGVEAFEHDLEAMAFDRISVEEARGIVPVLNPETVVMAGYAAPVSYTHLDVYKRQQWPGSGRSGASSHDRRGLSAALAGWPTAHT